MTNFLSPVIDGFIIPFLSLSYQFIPNYGLGIIILTFGVKFIFYPLTKKGFESMKKMQTIQPKMEELKKKHKGNPQKMQSEIMELYKAENVNPFSSCLPQLVQLPIFIALFFSMTSDSFVNLLSQEGVYQGFIPYWIDDLSQPDRFYILPILIGVATYLSQKFSPSMASGPSAQIQQQMMNFLPFLMVFICFKMPAGVLLYWSTQTIMTGFQQYWIQNKKNVLKKESI